VSRRMVGTLITLLVWGGVVYLALPHVFAGKTYYWCAGYLLLLVSFVLSLALTRALKREIERFALPPAVAFGRLATQVFFIGTVASYPTLGLGDLSDLAALTLFFPYMTAVFVETILRWNSHRETTQPLVFTSSLMPRLVASGLLVLAMWKWRELRHDTAVFLITAAGASLLGGRNIPSRQRVEGMESGLG